MISLWNRSESTFLIAPGDRIAQLVLIPVIQAPLMLVEEFSHSQRGTDGFGSTGQQ